MLPPAPQDLSYTVSRASYTSSTMSSPKRAPTGGSCVTVSAALVSPPSSQVLGITGHIHGLAGSYTGMASLGMAFSPSSEDAAAAAVAEARTVAPSGLYP